LFDLIDRGRKAFQLKTAKEYDFIKGFVGWVIFRQIILMSLYNITAGLRGRPLPWVKSGY
jgi:hypothetical protein